MHREHGDEVRKTACLDVDVGTLQYLMEHCKTERVYLYRVWARYSSYSLLD